MTHKLVRIKPANKRESHTALGLTIRKSDGWCKVAEGIADQLAKEKMSELNPEASPYVFDVLEEDEAREIAEIENAKVEPAGTIDHPKEKVPAPPPPAEADAPVPRSRARSER